MAPGTLAGVDNSGFWGCASTPRAVNRPRSSGASCWWFGPRPTLWPGVSYHQQVRNVLVPGWDQRRSQKGWQKWQRPRVGRTWTCPAGCPHLVSQHWSYLCDWLLLSVFINGTWCFVVSWRPVLGPKWPIYELIGSAPWPGALFGGSRVNFEQGRRDDWGGGREGPFEVNSLHAAPIGIMLNAEKFTGDRSQHPRPSRCHRPWFRAMVPQRPKVACSSPKKTADWRLVFLDLRMFFSDIGVSAGNRGPSEKSCGSRGDGGGGAGVRPPPHTHTSNPWGDDPQKWRNFSTYVSFFLKRIKYLHLPNTLSGRSPRRN